MYVWEEEEQCGGNERRRSRLTLPPHRSSSQMYPLKVTLWGQDAREVNQEWVQGVWSSARDEC
eukprot:gene15274-634_t